MIERTQEDIEAFASWWAFFERNGMCTDDAIIRDNRLLVEPYAFASWTRDLIEDHSYTTRIVHGVPGKIIDHPAEWKLTGAGCLALDRAEAS